MMTIQEHPFLQDVPGVKEHFWSMFIMDALIGNNMDKIKTIIKEIPNLTGAFYIRMHTYYKKFVKLGAA